MPALSEQTADGVCAAHGAHSEREYELGYEPVVNDPQASGLVSAVVDELAPGARTAIDPIMGGDDFSAYLAAAPGCYAFLGAGSEEAGATYPHHHPRFRIDERALATGVRLHVAVALRALEEGMKLQHHGPRSPVVGISRSARRRRPPPLTGAYACTMRRRPR